MKRNRRNNLIITLSVLVVLVIGITIVYAALSVSLKVSTSNVTQNIASWNVGFAQATTVKGYAQNSSGSTTGISCGNASATTNSISIEKSVLTKPGDICYWDFTLKNSGTIDAKLTSVTVTSPKEVSCSKNDEKQYVCGNIAYSIYHVYSGRWPLYTEGEVLSAGENQALRISMTLTGSISSSQQTQSGLTYTFIWSQN